VRSSRTGWCTRTSAGDAASSDPDGSRPAVARNLRRLWEPAGRIHEAAINGGDIRQRVREEARDLIGELLVLSERLLEPDSAARSRVEEVDRG
jgi:hypothetical protein